MCCGPLLGKIIAFTVPIMLMNALQLLYNAADIVVVGRFEGEQAVAAVGATSSLINLIVNVFIGLSVGVNVCVGKYIGAKSDRDAEEATHTTAALGIISGILVFAIGIVLAEPMLRLMATPEDILPLSLLYVRIYFIGAPANLFYNFIAAVLRAKGDTKNPLYILTAAGAVNVALNFLFVSAFSMGVAGVAVATVISQYLSAVLIAVFASKSDGMCKLNIREIRLYSDKVKSIIKIGLPSGIQGSVFSLSAMVIQSAINSFGSAAIAGNTAAGSIDTFSYIIFNAFSTTVVAFVAQNRGAGEVERVEKSVRICLTSAIVTAIISGIAIYLLAEPLLQLYLPGETEAISFGIIRLKYICIPYFFLAAMDVMGGALRGLGSSVCPTVISMIGSCGIRIAWIYTVFYYFGTIDVLYLSFPLAWAITFIALAVAYYRTKRLKLKN